MHLLSNMATLVAMLDFRGVNWYKKIPQLVVKNGDKNTPEKNPTLPKTNIFAPENWPPDIPNLEHPPFSGANLLLVPVWVSFFVPKTSRGFSKHASLNTGTTLQKPAATNRLEKPPYPIATSGKPP